MHPVISSGVLIVGIGIGLSSPKLTNKPEPGAITCHCECGAGTEKQAESGVTYRELILAVIVGVLLGAMAILAAKQWIGQAGFTYSTAPASPVKGKGRRGVFGSALALTLQEG